MSLILDKSLLKLAFKRYGCGFAQISTCETECYGTEHCSDTMIYHFTNGNSNSYADGTSYDGANSASCISFHVLIKFTFRNFISLEASIIVTCACRQDYPRNKPASAGTEVSNSVHRVDCVILNISCCSGNPVGNIDSITR